MEALSERRSIGDSASVESGSAWVLDVIVVEALYTGCRSWSRAGRWTGTPSLVCWIEVAGWYGWRGEPEYKRGWMEWSYGISNSVFPEYHNIFFLSWASRA